MSDQQISTVWAEKYISITKENTYNKAKFISSDKGICKIINVDAVTGWKSF